MVIAVKSQAAGSKAGKSSEVKARPVSASPESQCLWEGAFQPLLISKGKPMSGMEQRLGNVRASGVRMESSHPSTEAGSSG